VELIEALRKFHHTPQSVNPGERPGRSANAEMDAIYAVQRQCKDRRLREVTHGLNHLVSRGLVIES
jgi:hypothetical protein